MLKRKFGDRSNWKRVLERQYIQTNIQSDDFTGHITLLKIFKTAEPLLVEYKNNRVCILDDGYMWLQHFPSDKHHSVTTMFDAKGEVIQWYIDICYRNGINEVGVPWMDDLFLDIVVLPSGEVIHKDADELEESLADGAIDTRLYNMAKAESVRLTTLIHENKFNLLKLSKAHRDLLLELLRQKD